MEKRDDYEYIEIRDALVCLNQRVSLLGVVVEFGLPKRTRGPDWICTLKIVDQSNPKPGIAVNFFAGSVDGLPLIASLGDIIILSHVVMEIHNEGVYINFNKKFSSFALYEGRDGQDFHPYKCSPNFRRKDKTSQFVASLRKWLIDFHLDEESNGFSYVREMRKGERMDLVCKILYLSEVAKNAWVVLVWDGTDSPPSKITTKPDIRSNHPFPLQMGHLSLSRDIMRTFPTVGTILPIIIDTNAEKHVLHLLHPGKWMKFLNILCEVNGVWHGVLTPFTKLRHTSDNDNIVLSSQRCYDKRLSLKMGRIPSWCFPWCPEITEVDYDNVPFATVMDVLTYSKVTAKFKCMVRVVDVFPWRAEDFCSHLGTFCIRLTIEDSTARLHAFVYSEDGEELFGGYPSIDEMKRKRNKLLGVAENDNDGKIIEGGTRNPPWVECCLKSYYVDKNDVWGSRQYRIFGTKLL